MLEWTCTGEDIIYTKRRGTLYWCVSGQGWSDAGGKRTESKCLTSGAAHRGLKSLGTLVIEDNKMMKMYFFAYVAFQCFAVKQEVVVTSVYIIPSAPNFTCLTSVKYSSNSNSAPYKISTKQPR